MDRRSKLAARLLMSRLAERMTGGLRSTDPVRYADLRTSMDDARTAFTIALGLPMDDIDPRRGYNISRKRRTT